MGIFCRYIIKANIVDSLSEGSNESVSQHHANRNKSRLLFSSAEMFKKPLCPTV